ncbi:sulfotransferase family protein [Pseudoalteromonas sp. NBT06-2]|uniref:sulfotransferase n=1 Tax=Pseudoalteromonas sp. NBT06-2 TaxID=2025950 RepID=UPI000BA5F590|nr:sulfotransferase [Pseudoalteromonas sp. NBT06-2]PAJ74024.1 sulfotransferase family protein [Pseudoalteromonas sp. NBT06-2]
MTEQKIFIIGLPRTATTSVCVAMLKLGFKTSHTAYTKESMDTAQVIADTPIFCDYQKLDIEYPNAKFIYLERKCSSWLPSIRQLLTRMLKNLQRTDGGFNPTLKRCYNTVFSPITIDNIGKDDFLLSCYQAHQQGIYNYFKNREQDLLTIDVSDENSFQALLAFLDIDARQTDLKGFERINIGGKVTAWKQIKSPLKIEATKKGKVDRVRP